MLRKIMSEEDKIARESRNKKIMVIILGVIMLMSTAGYFVSDMMKTKTESIKYQGIEFKQDAYGYWSFEISGYKFQMINTPIDTMNVSVQITSNMQKFSQKPLYFSVESDYSEQAKNEIARNLNLFIERADNACLSKNCSGNYAIKSCDNDNVIIFKENFNNLSRVYDSGNCTYIDYSNGEQVKASDAFLYRLIGLQ